MYIKCHNVYVLRCLIMLWYLLCIFSPTFSDAETWSISVGCFPSAGALCFLVHVTVKVITQIAACLLGLASLLFAVWSYGLRGPPCILRYLLLYFFVEICVLVHWHEFLGWLFGYGGMSLFHWRNLTDGTAYVTSAVRWRGTELPMIIYHPCNLEAEHAGNSWKRKCLFWIIIFLGFKNRGDIPSGSSSRAISL